MLERWDRHNQKVMDRDRTRDITEWTIGSALLISVNLLWIAGRLTPAVAIVAQALVLVVATVGLIRLVRRRRERHETSAQHEA